MSKLDTLLQTTPLTASPNIVTDGSIGMILKPVPRLLVLVSDEDLDNVELPRQIWKTAKPQGLEVVLFALCNSFEQEPQVRRKLFTMAMIIRDETIHVDFQIRYGNDWLTLTQQEWRPTDILSCGSEHYIGLWGRSLSEILSSNFKTQVLVFFISNSSIKPISKFISNGIFWLGSICILSLFFWVEAMAIRAGRDFTRTFPLILCVLFEGGLLWIWASLF